MTDRTICVVKKDLDTALKEFLGLRNTYLTNGWENAKGFHIQIGESGQAIITGIFTCPEVKRLTSKQPLKYPYCENGVSYEQLYERLQLIENILGDTYRINDLKKEDEDEEEEDQEYERLLY